MKPIVAVLLLFACLNLALAQRAKPNDAIEASGLKGELQTVLEDEVAVASSIPGQLLHVQAPKLGLDASFAAGLFDRESRRKLDPHHLFRIASVTKTFTAAVILRLYEDGKLKLDDSIRQHLPKPYIELLDKGEYATGAITIRHLLHHTSGIYDYAADERYGEAVFADPQHRWTRLEQVQAAVKWGTPQFDPGTGFHYSDTGYILLGEIIEQVSKMDLAKAYRMLLDFKKLGLDETYFESLEPAPAGAKELSHPYQGDEDTVKFDPSFDLYGGGGLVSSVEDLAQFYRLLLQGKVFRKDSTLKIMLTVPQTNTNAEARSYAMGLYRKRIGADVCWGHTGFWGTAVFHCPASDVTIARHWNQAETGEDFNSNKLFQQLAEKFAMDK